MLYYIAHSMIDMGIDFLQNGHVVRKINTRKVGENKEREWQIPA